jgi:uncharacterized membrane protein SpoIIM required for sporulation
MREAAFLKQNAARWKSYETDRTTDPDVLAERFVQLTDDLSFARTFYPESGTTQYLNSLTGNIHQTIYKNKKEKTNRFASFWKYELPLLMWASHRQLAYSFVIFLAAVGMGALSASQDDTFVRLILGDGYVNTTLENIKNGDPMAVYKKQGELDMFLAITFNNVWVSFLAFVMGVLCSAGTAWILIKNGVMLGAFQYFFYQKGLLLPSVLTIWIHGTLEIAAIVIAGCAGFVMGNSLLFPKTYPRLYSFRQGAKRGAKIVAGLVPVFVAAGFLEGFVTRHTDMPLALSLGIIGLSAGFILFYFVFYPRYLSRTLPHDHRYSPHQL